MARAIDRLATLMPRYARPSGPAAAIVRSIGSRLPVVYAESTFSGLARRWKTQVEENAKRLAMCDEMPELLHNAIVGWDAMPRAEAARFGVILLEWEGAHPLARGSADQLARLLDRRGVTVIRVPLAGEDRFEGILSGIALGDQVSLFLADQRRVDPYPIDAISRLKASLASAESR
jgi:glucose/mannose-6-phosphate isomerase